jgi:2'-5' RNA ligase
MVRTFIAVELPPQIKHELEGLIERLNCRKNAQLRWVPIKNIHLTLKFIGEIEANKVPLIINKITGVVNKFDAFDIKIGGLGAFPRLQKPRVLWVGCDLPGAGFALQREMEESLVPLGIAKENRRFHPHLTLARVSKYARGEDIKQISDLILKFQMTKSWKLRVDQVKLFRSDLLPGGAQYGVISEFSLDSKDRD